MIERERNEKRHKGEEKVKQLDRMEGGVSLMKKARSRRLLI